MKNQGQKTILLVEDDATTMLVEAHLLKGFDYAVVTAKSGEEAVQIATGNDKIALVLMDIELGPGMDGAEAARQILGKRHLPIVFITAHTEKEYVERIKEVAGYGCVIKNSGNVVLQSSIEMAFNLFKSQEALKASEKKFRELAELLPETVFETDKQCALTFVNKNAFDNFGYTPENFVGGLNVLDMVAPDDRQRVLENIQRIVNGENIGASEFTMQRKDGSTFPSMIHSTVIIHDGKPAGLRGVVVDITERKRAEGLLQQERAMLDSIIDLNPYGIQLYDAEGHHVRANRAHFNMFQGVPAADYCFFDDPIAAKLGFHEANLAVKEGKTHVAPEMWYNPHWLKPELPDKLSCFRSTVFPIMNAEGKMEYFVVMFEDITERKKAEEKAKVFSDAIAGAFDCFLLTDEKGGITYANESASTTFGYIPEEFLKLNITKLDADPEIARKIAQEVTANGKWSGEVINIRKNGQKFTSLLSVYIIKDDKGKPKGSMGILRDITKRKQAEERLERFNRVAVDQELEMVRLEEEVNALLIKEGLPRKYETPEKIKKLNESIVKV